MVADHEPMMVDSLLPWARLMAVQAIHAFLCMGRHFIFVHYRVLEPGMTLGALAGSPHKVRRRLFRLHSWTRTIDQESRHDQPKCNDHSYKH
jgi:hypothetical protein